MEVFWAYKVEGGVCFLDEKESAHCVRVLRHREGDRIQVIDGSGTLYSGELTLASPKGCEIRVEETTPHWGAHPYRLTMAVCPTKNSDRYEWFLEKATETGTDIFVPLVGEHSERQVFNSARAGRILLSAAKQSLKGAVPELLPSVRVRDFIEAHREDTALRVIACCFEPGETDPRRTIMEVLSGSDSRDVLIMIGPEGDFSPAEVRLALEAGFIPVSIGESRLRTETAAFVAATAVYLSFTKQDQ